MKMKLFSKLLALRPKTVLLVFTIIIVLIGSQATNISIELLRDMQTGTEYPIKAALPKDAVTLAGEIDQLIGAIELRKKETEQEK